MSSNKCNTYVCRLISRKLLRNMQVTSLPAVEKHGKAGELPELQTAGIGWPGLVGPDIIVYNQNHQAKMGEPVPPASAILLAPPRGSPWLLSGETAGGLPPGMSWMVLANAGAMTMLIFLMIIFFHFINNYRKLLNYVDDQEAQIKELKKAGPSDVHVVQIQQEFPPVSESTDPPAPAMPPSYVETSASAPPPYSDPNSAFPKFETAKDPKVIDEPEPPTVCLIVDGGRTSLGLIVNEDLVPAGSQDAQMKANAKGSKGK